MTSDSSSNFPTMRMTSMLQAYPAVSPEPHLLGGDISSWSSISDFHLMVNGVEAMDVLYIRAHDGFRDDLKFAERRKEAVKAVVPNGGLLWGPYMFLGYTAKVGSLSWNAVRGDYQAQNCWALAAGGGREFTLPVAVDVENLAYVENGKRQSVPMPSADAYCSSFLIPAIEYLSSQMGRRPVLYSNANILLNYLVPVLGKFPILLECPLWVASWGVAGGKPAYWEDMKLASGSTRKGLKSYWKQFLLHQYYGDYKAREGVDDIDLNWCSGTRGQWKAWLKDSSKPFPGSVIDPIPPTPDPIPEPGPVDLALVLAKLDKIQGTLDRVFK